MPRRTPLTEFIQKQFRNQYSCRFASIGVNRARIYIGMVLLRYRESHTCHVSVNPGSSCGTMQLSCGVRSDSSEFDKFLNCSYRSKITPRILMECDGTLQYLCIVLIFRKCVEWINVIFPP